MVDLLPGRSLPIVLANSLRLMRTGLSKQVAMQQALNAAGYRPPSKPSETPSTPTPGASNGRR